MYLMYVDESGDPGLNSPHSPYYVLTGLILHELCWKDSLDRLIAFRRGIKATYGLPVRVEIHASQFITNASPIAFRIQRHLRLLILRDLLIDAAGNPNLNIITVVVNKNGKPPAYDVFEYAWQALIQRFENTIMFRNFPGPKNEKDKGIIFPDTTSMRKLTRLLRKMRYHNYIPGAGYGGGVRNLPIEIVIEDPNPRDSQYSYLIQVADCAAYFAHQFIRPNQYIRRQGARNFYRRLLPVICLHAAPNDPSGLGLVML